MIGKRKHWFIRYDDGDTEHVGISELKSILIEKENIYEDEEEELQWKRAITATNITTKKQRVSNGKKNSHNANGNIVLSKPKVSSYVGKMVSKVFDKDLYTGKVTEYFHHKNPKKRLWHITYEDGDEEDMTLSEMEDAVKL